MKDTKPPAKKATPAKKAAAKATAAPKAKPMGRPSNDTRVLDKIKKGLAIGVGGMTMFGLKEDADILAAAVPAIADDVLEIAKRHKWLYDLLLDSVKAGPYVGIASTLALGVAVPMLDRRGKFDNFPPLVRVLLGAGTVSAIAPRDDEDAEPVTDPAPDAEAPVVAES